MSRRPYSLKHASGALGGLLRELGMEGALRLGRISGNWYRIFDGPLSLHTSPESISGSTLTVNVDSPAWLHQAGFFKAAMLDKLRVFGIQNIRFRQGRVVRSDGGEAKPEPCGLAQEESDSIEKMVQSVRDTELREFIKRAAVASASRRSAVDRK